MGVMGAIAVSKEEEEQIEKLRKELRIHTKSGVIRAALKTLEDKVEEERLRREVEESVRRCAAADKQENRELFPAGVVRHISGE
jgi:pyrroline-5-carboxylate reductase